jgi:hypothetical protein
VAGVHGLKVRGIALDPDLEARREPCRVLSCQQESALGAVRLGRPRDGHARPLTLRLDAEMRAALLECRFDGPTALWTAGFKLV